MLNKYYPPDFDPSKIPKRKELKNMQMKVRMMLPMSIRCATCGTYMYKGTKFNCRKEDVVGDMYLGIMKFRFYFKCPTCASEMVMKTDPQNSDYEMEAGATRNFEPWRAADEVRDGAKKAREAEEMGNAMKALENRMVDSKMEMDILAALDEMKSMRARQATLDPAQVLNALKGTAGGVGLGEEALGVVLSDEQLAVEDEALIRSVVFRNSEKFVRRIDEEEDEEVEEESGGGGIAGEEVKGGIRSSGQEGVEEDGRKQGRKRPMMRDEGGVGPDEKRRASELLLSGGRSAGDSHALDAKLIPAIEAKPLFEVKPLKVKFAVKVKQQKDGPKQSTVGAAEAERSAAVKPIKGRVMAHSTHGSADMPTGATPDSSLGLGSGLGQLLAGYGDDDDSD